MFGPIFTIVFRKQIKLLWTFSMFKISRYLPVRKYSCMIAQTAVRVIWLVKTFDFSNSKCLLETIASLPILWTEFRHSSRLKQDCCFHRTVIMFNLIIYDTYMYYGSSYDTLLDLCHYTSSILDPPPPSSSSILPPPSSSILLLLHPPPQSSC